MNARLRSRIFITLLVVAVGVACCGRYLVYWDRPYAGRVVDLDTGEPIEGAVVAALYCMEVLSPAGPVPSCFRCEETFTDEQGRFRFPFVLTIPADPYVIISYFERRGPALGVFKPGYEGVERSALRAQLAIPRTSCYAYNIAHADGAMLI